VEEELVAAVKFRARAFEPFAERGTGGGVQIEARKGRVDLCLRRPEPMLQARPLEEPEVAGWRAITGGQIRRRITSVARDDPVVIRGCPGGGEQVQETAYVQDV